SESSPVPASLKLRITARFWLNGTKKPLSTPAPPMAIPADSGGVCLFAPRPTKLLAADFVESGEAVVIQIEDFSTGNVARYVLVKYRKPGRLFAITRT